MKIIKVESAIGDYGVLSFEKAYNKTKVSDFIKRNFDKAITTKLIDTSDDTLKITLYDLDISEEAFTWTKTKFIDYDDAKHVNYYSEFETI